MDMQISTTAATSPTPAKRGYTPARVYLSADGRQLLHVLPDGSTTARPVAFYRALLERSGYRERSALADLLGSRTAARLGVAFVTWLVRLLLVAWLAMHAGVTLPSGEAPIGVELPAE